MVLGIGVNNLAVLVAAIASMIVGALWYGPLFGKTWMRLSGISGQKLKQMKAKGMGKSYLMTFIASLVMAYVLSLIVTLALADTFVRGAVVGFWVWLGFVATEDIRDVIWGGKSMGMFWLKGIGGLVTLAIMGAILAVW